MRLLVLSLSLILTACGGGSTPPDNKTPVVYSPIPVLASSFENEMVAGKVLGPQNLPLDWMPCGPQKPDCGAFVAPATAFADFMRDGTYSMITHTMEYNAVNLSDSNRRGHIKFYQSVNGIWVDNTNKILKPDQTEGCLHASKAIVADFLQNGMPSVFFSCYGFDGPGFAPGERQRILLGQRDGTYKNIELPIINFCTCSSASAADINGDGYPDIVLTDNYQTYSAFVLINNKDGTFTVDTKRLPHEIIHKALYAVELVDFNNDGKYDIVVGGVEQCCHGITTPVMIYHNSNGYFTNGISIPSVPGYGMVLDMVYDNGYLYISRTIDDNSNFYGGYSIQRVKYSTLESSILHQGHTVLGEGKRFMDSIILYGNNIVGVSLLYKLSVGK